MRNFNITPEIFFRVGKWCFLIIAIMGIMNYIHLIKIQNIFTTIAFLASTIFNLTLSGFFHYLHKQQTPQITEEYASDDVEGLINQIKEAGK